MEDSRRSLERLPKIRAAIRCCDDRLNPPSAEAVELATLEWVAWFNHHRLLAPIGYMPPAEAEANYSRSQTGQAVMA